MRGTEKQIAWATDIQARKLADTLGYCATAEGPGGTPAFFELMLGLEDDARFWIDHRDDDVAGVLAGIKARHVQVIKPLMAIVRQRYTAGLPLDRQSLVDAYKSTAGINLDGLPF